MKNAIAWGSSGLLYMTGQFQLKGRKKYITKSITKSAQENDYDSNPEYADN